MFEILRQIIRVGIVRGRRANVASNGDPTQRTIARAACIRHVDSGSCNGCELEVQALTNPYHNIEAGGLSFVASPRHADLLLVTGPVSPPMREALERTYDAMPSPKRVLAVGDCAIDGGLFGKGYASLGGVAEVIAVDAVVPGCPPSPAAIIDGIRRALGSAGEPGEPSPAAPGSSRYGNGDDPTAR